MEIIRPNTAHPIDITIYDPNAADVVTGATILLSIERVSDGLFWGGSAWGAYATVTMTERTGNVAVEGEYRYTLSATAVGSAEDTFKVNVKYTAVTPAIRARGPFKLQVLPVGTLLI